MNFNQSFINEKNSLAKFALIEFLNETLTFFTLPLPQAGDLMVVWLKVINQFQNHNNIRHFISDWKNAWKGNRSPDKFINFFSIAHIGCPEFVEFIAELLPQYFKGHLYCKQIVNLVMFGPRQVNDTFKSCIAGLKKMEQKFLVYISKCIEEIVIDFTVKLIYTKDDPDTEQSIISLTRHLAKWIEWDPEFVLLVFRNYTVDTFISLVTQCNHRQSTYILALLNKFYQTIQDNSQPWIHAKAHDSGINYLINYLIISLVFLRECNYSTPIFS